MDDRLKLGWQGFEQAERQLLDEIQKNGDPLVPLANLLQWAYAIDQWHKNRIADGENELVQLLGQDVIGETYNGFRVARASVAHDLSLVAGLVNRVNPRVVQVSGAGRAQIITPPVTSEWQWTQTPAISPNNKGLPSYRRHLAGKPMSSCLPAVRGFLRFVFPIYWLRSRSRPNGR